MSARRGLTLIEILVSTILLTLITVVCLPLFRDAIRLLSPPDAERAQADPDLGDLADLAERFLLAPSDFEVDSLTAVDELELAWSDEPSRPPVLVERLAAPEAAAGQCWFRFTCADLVLHRWMRIE